ncbi:MAG: hypothetical protein BWX71_02041 [Deltaproteobacteria bacterium ADurb.Bin072]|nr:MAG: hypothetical protein BWX71_02041 [Deltaproteobacteria bacterium ADurb.Bin072]
MIFLCVTMSATAYHRRSVQLSSLFTSVPLAWKMVFRRVPNPPLYSALNNSPNAVRARI